MSGKRVGLSQETCTDNEKLKDIKDSKMQTTVQSHFSLVKLFRTIWTIVHQAHSPPPQQPPLARPILRTKEEQRGTVATKPINNPQEIKRVSG